MGGLAKDGKRTRHGLITDDSPTDGQRACLRAYNGLHTGLRRHFTRRVENNARGCLRTLRVRLTPNLPSESIRFLRHIYHGRETDRERAADGLAYGLLTGDKAPDRIATISSNWNLIYIHQCAIQCKGGRENSQWLVNPSRVGKRVGGHLSLLGFLFVHIRRGKGGNMFFFADPPCIGSRIMLYFALPLWGNSSDTVRRGPSNGHLIRPDKMGGNACGKPGKAPQAFFCCRSFIKGETDRRPIRGTLCESGSATVRRGAARWGHRRPTEGTAVTGWPPYHEGKSG